ncbi:hypothetical protein DER45DRAFT_618955 [Fusarium avenaceum]|nr:hypothetical protein DER45DRAFT_618955 [Fusarium avenaceum]
MSQKSTLPADHQAYIRASINNGWKKLNKYYDILGESPLFAAAIILHPRFGISCLEATWVSEEQLAWGLCEETTKYDAAARTMGQEDDQYTQWVNRWRDHRASFPSLSNFALDVFAIPAMRLSMGSDTLERVQCLKNWVSQGGVKLGSWMGS